ncbi:MAG: hypothetical protein Q7Q73_16480 [Verrucomicrobiota bacterium JB024]|nr:hypothetical protein [Verrucomicrobiota bacterium JB024]
MKNKWQRPRTAAEVAAWSDTPEAFGRNLRDWQHELRRVHARPEFARRVRETPALISSRLGDGGVGDAYLAAYVDWLCGKAGIDAPDWVDDSKRVADKAWYDTPKNWKQLLVLSPGAFRQRHLFTIPENVLTLRSGRPSVPNSQKRVKNAERQRRYRQRVKEKLRRLEELEARLK